MQPPQLPTIFLDRLKNIVPAHSYSDIVASFVHEPATIFRVNYLKMDADELIEELKDAGLNPQPYSFPLKEIDVFTIPNSQRRALTKCHAYQQGKLYIQNPSSMLPVLILDPQPGEEILDLAAAPGGKTILMAQRMQDQGRIAAVEKIKARFFKLQAQLKIYGVTNCKTYCKDGAIVWRQCHERFDRILLDAPCSSEARFNIHNPKSFAFWSEKKIKDMQRKQKKLLYSAIQSLKPGGVLVYCTCSFAPEENEAVIDKMLKRFANQLKLEPINLPLPNLQPGLTQWQKQIFNPQVQNAVRILPTETMEGFFICQLRKLDAIRY